jgi:hypothetical protein
MSPTLIKKLNADQLAELLGVPLDWAHCGALIEKHQINLHHITDNIWGAESRVRHGYGYGATPLLAIGRAIIAERHHGADSVTL